MSAHRHAHSRRDSRSARRLTAALCLSAGALLVPAMSAVATAPLTLSASVEAGTPTGALSAAGVHLAHGDLGIDPAMTARTSPSEQLRLGGLLAQEQLRNTVGPQNSSVNDLVRRLHGGAQLQQAGRLGASPAAVLALSFALSQQGKPYLWGGTGPDAWDCSGLTQAAYRAAGVTLPRVAADQAQVGQAVAFNDLLPGDLVFFAFDPVRAAGIHHVAMYLGDGLVVHAPKTGDVIKVSRLWLGDYAGAVRVTAGVGGGLRSVPGLRPSGTPVGVKSVGDAAAVGLVPTSAPRTPAPTPAVPGATAPSPKPSAVAPKAASPTGTGPGTVVATGGSPTGATPSPETATPVAARPVNPTTGTPAPTVSGTPAGAPAGSPVPPLPASQPTGGPAPAPSCPPAVPLTDAAGQPLVPGGQVPAPTPPAAPLTASGGAPLTAVPAPGALCGPGR